MIRDARLSGRHSTIACARVTDHWRHALSAYARDVSHLSSAETSTEQSFYPAIKALIEASLGELALPLDVRASTSEARRGGGRDAPDFAIYDGAGSFVMLYVEVKRAGVDIADLARSTQSNDQIGRYLDANGAVLLCTVSEFALVTIGDNRRASGPVPPSRRRLGEVVQLWPAVRRAIDGARISDEDGGRLLEVLEEALTRHTPIASPETLARVLARQARRALTALPAEFTAAIAPLRTDFASALGLSFEGEAGEHFFRSSLIQTVFYGIFAAWLLRSSEWRQIPSGPFDWRRTGEYLRIPFLAGLFHEIQNPVRLRELGLREHLDAAAATLDRVDEREFFARLRPAGGDYDEFTSTIVYFYEPFLAAFDPELREELGVWYTPPDIVRYQVRRIDRLLREELGFDRGLADETVVILDPACGTGAYLIETLRCIAETLRAEGVEAELAATLRSALEHRIRGFEILTAPFVVAHLQLFLLLAELGAPPDETHRAGIYLTNALTGWSGHDDEVLHFPELQQEHDAAQRVKRDERVIVVLGNPPYNRFVGASMHEEGALVDPYKGVQRDDRGRQIGQSELWTRWGVRKQLLDDLYVRFFRLAEERIGIRAEFGIISYISNSSFLTGRSHPIMRESLLGSFDDVWIDNLHGNRLANERTPWGDSCATVFSTQAGSAGVKVGVAITTWLKRPAHVCAPANTSIHYRDFWGGAEGKRASLLASLDMRDWPAEELAGAVSRPAGPRDYAEFRSSADRRWKLLPYDITGGYEDWPSIDQMFSESVAGVNINRGLDRSVIDTDAQSLAARMEEYFSPMADDEFFERHPELGRTFAGYAPATVRARLRGESTFEAGHIVPYELFPLDARWLYYELSGKLLNRPRSELAEQLTDNEFLVLVNESRRSSETKPLLAHTAFDLHLFDVGAQAFYAERRVRVEQALVIGDEQYVRTANLTPSLWLALKQRWILEGDLPGAPARRLARELFRVALAIGHSPNFQRDFAGSLAHDWLHVPIPRERRTFEQIAALGDQVGILLDPFAALPDLSRVLHAVLGDEAPKLAVLATTDGGPIGDRDLRVEIAHFGSAPGGWIARQPAVGEPWHPEWGESSGDLRLNSRVFLRHVPERVWGLELGGYQVIKKWIGYREARRRNGQPMSLAEKDHLRGMVQRLAALLLLYPQLDLAYAATATDALTAHELGLE
jgi:type ISP restriction-modification system protein/N-6 DNA methylase